MITQSNIRSAVFRPGGAISFELLVLWFYLVLHLMKDWEFGLCLVLSKWADDPLSLLNDEQMSNEVGVEHPTRKGRVFLKVLEVEVEMEVGGCKILGILYELQRNHLPRNPAKVKRWHPSSGWFDRLGNSPQRKGWYFRFRKSYSVTLPLATIHHQNGMIGNFTTRKDPRTIPPPPSGTVPGSESRQAVLCAEVMAGVPPVWCCDRKICNIKFPLLKRYREWVGEDMKKWSWCLCYMILIYVYVWFSESWF